MIDANSASQSSSVWRDEIIRLRLHGLHDAYCELLAEPARQASKPTLSGYEELEFGIGAKTRGNH